MLPSSTVVCTKVPTSICEGLTFAVDINSLESPGDVTSHDMGVWKNNGVESTRVHVLFSNDKSKVVSVKKQQTETNRTYLVKCVYRLHSTDNKVTACIYSEENK